MSYRKVHDYVSGANLIGTMNSTKSTKVNNNATRSPKLIREKRPNN